MNKMPKMFKTILIVSFLLDERSLPGCGFGDFGLISLPLIVEKGVVGTR
jgi:hypothetical protein